MRCETHLTASRSGRGELSALTSALDEVLRFRDLPEIHICQLAWHRSAVAFALLFFFLLSSFFFLLSPFFFLLSPFFFLLSPFSSFLSCPLDGSFHSFPLEVLEKKCFTGVRTMFSPYCALVYSLIIVTSAFDLTAEAAHALRIWCTEYYCIYE